MLHMLLTMVKPSWRKRRAMLQKTALVTGHCACFDSVFDVEAEGGLDAILAKLEKKHELFQCPACGREYELKNEKLYLVDVNTFEKIVKA